MFDSADDWRRQQPSSVITTASIIFTVTRRSNLRMGLLLFLFRLQCLEQILELAKEFIIVGVNQSFVVKLVERFQKHLRDLQVNHVISVTETAMLTINLANHRMGSKNSEKFKELH